MRTLLTPLVALMLLALLAPSCSPRAARFMTGAAIVTAATASMVHHERRARPHHHYHVIYRERVVDADGRRVSPLYYYDPDTGQMYIYDGHAP